MEINKQDEKQFQDPEHPELADSELHHRRPSTAKPSLQAFLTSEYLGSQEEDVLQPQVLFSMFEPPELALPYMQFVFPDRIQISREAQAPKYFTFMSTGEDGFTNYFHCLIIQEEVNMHEVNRDFIKEPERSRNYTRDVADFEQLRQLEEQQMQALMPSEVVDSLRKVHKKGDNPMSHNDGDEEIYIYKINRLRQQFKNFDARRKNTFVITAAELMENTKNLSLRHTNLMQSTIQNQQELMKGISPDSVLKKDKGLQNYNQSWIMRKEENKSISIPKKATTNNFMPGLLQSQSVSYQKVQTLRNATAKKSKPSHDSDQNVEPRCSHYQEESRKGVFPQITVQKMPSQDFSQKQDSNRVFSTDSFSEKSSNKETPMFNESPAARAAMAEDNDYELNHQHQEQLQEQAAQDLKNEKYYAPVAYIIQTETEYHDVFRDILLSLIEVLSCETEAKGLSKHNQRLFSFSELLSKLSFLKTLPTPPFNSIMNIEWPICCKGTQSTKKIVLKENPFDQIPHKSELPIKALFECLDIQSILTCWKALLFDRSLILVSTQSHLLFLIADALKQLIFPLTWQNSYIVPGNKDLLAHADGTMTVIYGCRQCDATFDYFETLNQQENAKMVICDIDASMTNEPSDLPQAPNESIMRRILALLKNKKSNNYDIAYQEDIPAQEDVIKSIRQQFFQVLKPFVSNLQTYIDTKKGSTFFQYFDKEKYQAQFSGLPCFEKFAKQLTKSSQFIHFCDDCDNEDFNNYMMLNAILKQNQPTQEKNIFKQVSPRLREEQSRTEGQEDQVLEMTFQMPSFKKRMLLFEKIDFLIEMDVAFIKKKGSIIDKERLQDFLKGEFGHFNYQKLITQIRNIYSQKVQRHDTSVSSLDLEIKDSEQEFNEEIKVQDQKNNLLMRIHKTGVISKELVESLKASQFKLTFKTQEQSDQQNTESENYQLTPQSQIESPTHNQVFSQPQRLIAPAFKQQPAIEPQTPAFVPFNHGSDTELDIEIQKEPQTLTSKFKHLEKRKFSSDFSNPGKTYRSTKLIYCDCGLLNFTQSLFGILSTKNVQKINYYFLLERELKHMKKQMSKNQRNSLVEQVFRDFPEDKRPKTTEMMESHNALIVDFDENNLRSSINSTTCQPEILRIESEWALEANLFGTYQMIFLKQQLLEMTLYYDKAQSLIFQELLEFPQDHKEIFPKAKFMEIWKTLTSKQKDVLFFKYGGYASRWFQVQMLSEDYMRSSNEQKNQSLITKTRRSTGSTNEEQMAQLKTDPTFTRKIKDQISAYQSFQEEQRLKEEMRNNKQKKLTTRNSDAKEKEHKEKLKKEEDKIMKAETAAIDKVREKQREKMLKQKSEFQKRISVGSQLVTKVNDAICPPIPNAAYRKGTVKNSILEYGISSDLRYQELEQSQELKHKELYDPDLVYGKLLEKVLKIWNDYKNHIVKSRGVFKRDKIPEILEQLLKIEEKYVKKYEKYEPIFANPSSKETKEIYNNRLQAYLMNLFNFHVLFKLATVMCCVHVQTNICQKLANFNNWQLFLQTCQFNVASRKYDLFTLMHQMLRANVPFPKMSMFIILIPPVEYTNLVVVEPHKLVSFGLFFPLLRTCSFQIFSAHTLDHQLREEARKYLKSRLHVKENYQFLMLPIWLDFYFEDFGVKDLLSLLEFLNKEVFIENCDPKGQIKALIAKIKARKKDQLTHSQLFVDYRGFDWKLCLEAIPTSCSYKKQRELK